MTTTAPEVTRIAGFYVTVKRDSQTGVLLGPYDSKAEAAANVERAKAECHKIDVMAHFYGYGTTRVRKVRPGAVLPVGLLNDRIGLTA